MNGFQARTGGEQLGVSFARNLFMPVRFKSGLIVLALVTVGCTSPCLGQTPQQTPVSPPEQHSSEDSSEQQGSASASCQLPDRQLPGSISGKIGRASCRERV